MYVLFQAGLHASHLTLKYNHNGKLVIVDLKRNDNLIPKEHFVRYQGPNGDTIIKNFTKTEVNLCHYHVSVNRFNLKRFFKCNKKRKAYRYLIKYLFYLLYVSMYYIG